MAVTCATAALTSVPGWRKSLITLVPRTDSDSKCSMLSTVVVITPSSTYQRAAEIRESLRIFCAEERHASPVVNGWRASKADRGELAGQWLRRLV
jgi:hypothetical protein